MNFSVIVLCTVLVTSGLAKDVGKKVGGDKKSGKREVPSKSYLPPLGGGGGAIGGLGQFGGHGISAGQGSLSGHGGSFSSHGGSFGGSFGGGHGGSFSGPHSGGFGGSFGGLGGPLKAGPGGSFGGQGATVETYIIAPAGLGGSGLGGKGGFTGGRFGGIGVPIKLGGGNYAGGYGSGSFGNGKITTLKTIAIPASFSGHGGLSGGAAFNGNKFDGFNIGYGDALGGSYSSGLSSSNFGGGHLLGGGAPFGSFGGGNAAFNGAGFGGDVGHNGGLGSGLSHGIGFVAIGNGDASLAGLEGAGLFSGGFGYGYGGGNSFASAGPVGFGAQSLESGHSVGIPSGSYGVPLGPPLSSYSPSVPTGPATIDAGQGLEATGHASGAAGISAGYETPAYATGQKSLRHYSSGDQRYNVVESRPIAVTPSPALHTSYSSSSSSSHAGSGALSAKAPFRPSVFLGATHESADGSTAQFSGPGQDYSNGIGGFAAPASEYGSPGLSSIEQSFAGQQHSYAAPQQSFVVSEQHQAYLAPSAQGLKGQSLGVDASAGFGSTGFGGSQHGAIGQAPGGSYLPPLTKPAREYLPPASSHH